MTDEDRIAKKAHELWEAEGHPHGRDQAHWDQAKEIVAIQDSATATLLPRESGANPPVESAMAAIDNEGEVPGLTDTGEHDLTATSREPAETRPKPAPKQKVAAKTASNRADASKTSKAVAPAKKAGASKAK